MTDLCRPLLRYFGGKWRLAPWIISHFPPHKTYVEPFGGSASVLLRKPRSNGEIYNDLDNEVFNLFSVLRSDRADDLIRAVALTPFSRADFDLAYQPAEDPIESARRLIVRSFFGYGGALSIQRRPTSFRSVNKLAGNPPAAPWLNYPDALAGIVFRLQGVVIENRPALRVLTDHDGSNTLFYVDPPYPHETRSQKMQGGQPHHRYRHEMSTDDHQELLAALKGLSGKVVISGYDCPLYAAELRDWHRATRETTGDKGTKRTEILWLNFDPRGCAPPSGLFSQETTA